MVSVPVWLPVPDVPSSIAVVPRVASVCPRNFSFPAALRLRSKADFARLRKARRISVGGLHLVYRTNEEGHARIGFAVSRKFGNAVRRNRFKRVLKDIFRRHPIRDLSVDLMVIPARGCDPESDFSAAMLDALSLLTEKINRS